VRWSCRLCIAVSFEPLVFWLVVDNLRAMTVAPEICHISADHGAVWILWAQVWCNFAGVKHSAPISFSLSS
jgi:hypothetical protein